MKKLKALGISLAVISTLGFIGCGGGGGSSSDNLSFPSNAVVAEPTPKNAKEVRNAIITRTDIDYMPGLNKVNNNASKVNNSSKLNILLFSNILIFELTKDINMQSYSLNEVVDDIESCSDGGTIRYKGSGDDVNGGSLTITANNCKEGDIIINGSVYMTIKNLDSSVNEFKDHKVKFITNFTVEDLSNGDKVTILPNSYGVINIIKFDSFGNWKEVKFFMSAKKVINNKYKYGFKDCIYYFTKKYNSMKYYQTQCRIYINNLTSYVDYDKSYDMSKTPFVVSKNGTLTDGKAYYNMANNGKVKIVVVESNEAKVYLDDGNGSFKLVK